jgi:DNA-binding PucR family transcriptional regulator
MSWSPPPPRIRELIRQGAQAALAAPEEWLEELDAATLSGGNRARVADDPVLAAAIRRANRSNLLFWAAANVRAPGQRVPANLGDTPLAVARDLVRRGLDESALDAYRAGEAVAVRLWMRICFSLTTDPRELRELLDVSCRSIAAFVDDTVYAISAQIAQERSQLTSGTHAERREAVTLLLEGAPIPRERAEQRLGYRLAGEHTAAIVWSDDPSPDLGALDRAAELIGAAARDPRPLNVLATAATRWVWVHGHPDLAGLELRDVPAVRVAAGPAAAGLDGFRGSHLDALTVQRMLARLDSPRRLATYEEVELVALLTREPEPAGHFVRRTLGELETAPAEITETVRVYLAAECNASRAAARLYTHRNTLLRRLARADQLLPRPLAENVVNVAAALEVLRWRGPAASLFPPSFPPSPAGPEGDDQHHADGHRGADGPWLPAGGGALPCTPFRALPRVRRGALRPSGQLRGLGPQPAFDIGLGGQLLHRLAKTLAGLLDFRPDPLLVVYLVTRGFFGQRAPHYRRTLSLISSTSVLTLLTASSGMGGVALRMRPLPISAAMPAMISRAAPMIRAASQAVTA